MKTTHIGLTNAGTKVHAPGCGVAKRNRAFTTPSFIDPENYEPCLRCGGKLQTATPTNIANGWRAAIREGIDPEYAAKRSREMIAEANAS